MLVVRLVIESHDLRSHQERWHRIIIRWIKTSGFRVDAREESMMVFDECKFLHLDENFQRRLRQRSYKPHLSFGLKRQFEWEEWQTPSQFDWSLLHHDHLLTGCRLHFVRLHDDLHRCLSNHSTRSWVCPLPGDGWSFDSLYFLFLLLLVAGVLDLGFYFLLWQNIVFDVGVWDPLILIDPLTLWIYVTCKGMILFWGCFLKIVTFVLSVKE